MFLALMFIYNLDKKKTIEMSERLKGVHRGEMETESIEEIQ